MGLDKFLGTCVPKRPLRKKLKKYRKSLIYNGRGERIRTSGPCLPKTVLYQAELLPDRRAVIAVDGGAFKPYLAARARGPGAGGGQQKTAPEGAVRSVWRRSGAGAKPFTAPAVSAAARGAGTRRQAQASAPIWMSMPLVLKASISSPVSYISRTMSQPPKNSPLT